MGQKVLFNDLENDDKDTFDLGSDLKLELIGGRNPGAILYRLGVFVKKVYFSDKVAKRRFVVDTIDLDAKPSRLAKALKISRQTIHNYLETRKHFGLEGLDRGYEVSYSKSLRKQRKLHSQEFLKGNKAKLVAEIRKKEREEEEKEKEELKQLSFSFGNGGLESTVEKEEHVFFEEHDWIESRYAGVFINLITLFSEWKWLNLVLGYFGKAYKIFMVFLLMSSRNICSIEQTKNVRSREGGIILGIKRLPSKPILWEWFYIAAKMQVSKLLLFDYFRNQVVSGLVAIWLWFTDGHLLPYTGKKKTHYAYSTQRRMPFPGQTNMVTCDESGRIVDFEIQEGKGNMRGHILSLGDKWWEYIPNTPVMIFDREGQGVEFYFSLVKKEVPFVSWEKHIDSNELDALSDDKFSDELKFNGKKYRFFEGEKTFTYEPEESKEKKQVFTLRRIYIWNQTSKRRTCGLAFSGDREMSVIDCARAILSRWGSSENTFKHINRRHPYHYHPGFKFVKSERQEISNPEIKERERKINQIKKELNKLYKKHSKTEEKLTPKGKTRKNSVKEKLEAKISELELELESIKKEKSKLPQKVDVSTLENYKSFKRLDNEGKYLFDFVTTSVWNARKQMVDWLRPFYNQENELVDMFYAIIDCHGWVKSSKQEVIVRLEPLQQPKRLAAQKQLCRKLTNLNVQTPTGKWMRIEVGESPFKNSKTKVS